MMEDKRISNKIVSSLLLLMLAWLMPLATLAQNHWVPQSATYEDNMTLTGVIMINGEEQHSTALEVGAFCGEECRGSMRPVLFPPTQQYVVQMTIYGEVGDLITFRLYDHDLGEELYVLSPDPITFSTTSLGSLMAPYELNFIHIVTIAATASPAEGGTISGLGEYTSGSSCTLTAIPNQGYCFYYWLEGGEIVSTDAEYSFDVTNSRELVCVFGLPLNVLAVVYPIEGGTVEGFGEFNYGSTCTLSATPNDGFVFISWNLNGEAISSLASYSFTVTESVELVAVFMRRFQIGDGTAGHGALPSQAYFDYTLSQQIYTADEIGGSKTINNICFFNKATYTISRIYDVYLVHTTKTAFDNNTDWIAVTESDRVFSGRVTMTHGVWSAIVFDRPFEYDGTSNLALIVDDNSGGWSSSMLCLSYNTDGNQTLHVSGRDTNYDPFNPGLYEGTLYSEKNQIVLGIDVNYRIVSVSANPSEAGTVSGGGTFMPGEICVLTAVPNEGYYFDSWSENGEVVSTESTYSFSVGGDRILVANFTFNPHTIVASANPSEFGSVSGGGTYLEGTECTLTATANTGYTFVDWTENGEVVSTEASYSFIVMGDRELVANFVLQSYVISASVIPNEGGAVSGADTYNHGNTCTLTATANTGYTFDNWTENGTIVSNAAVYSFEVTGCRTLVANFTDASGTGVLSGVFTVGEHAHVQFSKGNLQYQASTGTWRFATYQYDYIGNDNSNISQTYSGWIDLFGWGTSGYSHGANCYQPWSTSTSYSDYYAYGVYSNNLYSGNGQADWGYNAISNGGNLENSGWRTLTRPEWDFVLNTRSTISGIRYAKATVNGVNGVVLLPDDWTASTYALNSTNSISADYTTNTIAAEDWANVLEANGAVFLPAAGYRNGTSVYSFGQYGDYWSSSRCAMFNTYYVHFLSDNLYISSNSPRSSGHSVRLVRIAENYSYEINVTPNPLEGGVVSGGGTYEEGVECTLTATPTEDYIFSNWTENGNVVSTEATYSFIVSGDRTLVANFSLLQFDVIVSALPEEGGSVTGGGTYQYGQSCTLTAMANEGYAFVNWKENGEVVSTDATYSFAVTGDRELVANFAMQSYSISASANPSAGGSVSGAGSYDHGSTCTLTATANEGYSFTNWTENGEVISSEASFSFTVTGDRDLVANFIQIHPSINDDFNDGEINADYWTATGPNVYEEDGVIKIQQNVTDNDVRLASGFISIPESGRILIDRKFLVHRANNYFSGGYYIAFNGDEQNYIRIAYWHEAYIGKYGVYIDAQLNGITTEIRLCDALFDTWHNEVVLIDIASGTLVYCIDNNLVATNEIPGLSDMPQSYFHVWFYPYGWWTGHYQNMDFIKINVTEPSCHITVSSSLDEGGTVTGEGNYNYGDVCTLTAVPNDGYEFYYWSENGDVFSTEANASFIVTSGHDLVGVFGLPLNVTATASPSEGGAVYGAGEYNYGSTCTLTAAANEGYTFMYWTENDSQVSTDANYSFTVTESRDLVAHFALPFAITATASPTEGGTINGTGEYNYGSTCTLTAIANDCYSFMGWKENGNLVSTNAEYSFTVTSDHDLVAIFTDKSLLTVYDGTENNGFVPVYGLFCDAYLKSETVFPMGQIGEMNGGVIGGLRFYAAQTDVSWGNASFRVFLKEVDGSSISSFTGSEDATIVYEGSLNISGGVMDVVFTTPYQYNGGNLLIGFYNVNKGGYVKSSWFGESVEGASVQGYSYNGLDAINPTQRNFIPKTMFLYYPDGYASTYSINASVEPSNGGSVSGVGTYDRCTNCTLTATPNVGYVFRNWTENGEVISAEAAYSFAVTGDRNLVAYFVPMLSSISDDFNDGIINPEYWTATGPDIYEEEGLIKIQQNVTDYYVALETLPLSIPLDNKVIVDRQFYLHEALHYWNTGDRYFYGNVNFKFNGSDDNYIGICYYDDDWENRHGTYIRTQINGEISETRICDVVFDTWLTETIVLDMEDNTLTYCRDNGTIFTIDIPSISLDYLTVRFKPDGWWTGHYHNMDYININANVSNRMIVVSTNLNEAGVITGAGEHEYGSVCTLTATPNEGYEFQYWTENGETISTDPSYSFIVMVDRSLVAHFVPTRQTFSFSPGWSWLSTYVEQDGIDGLSMLEEGLAANGIMIKSQYDGFVSYNAGSWVGSLGGITNEKMYLINTSTPADVVITGPAASLSEHTITLNPNWNWISYPSPFERDINEALANLNATEGDVLKSQSCFAIYNTIYGWYGSLNTMTPGMGYMYQSHNNEDVAFVYSEGMSRSLKRNADVGNNHWVHTIEAYPQNMSMIVVVELNGEEVGDERYELAVFSGEECRGSVRLVYVEPLHRHVAFLSVMGEEEVDLSLALYDTQTGKAYFNPTDGLRFVANAVLGTPDSPYVARFGGMGVDENDAESIAFYPNPVRAGQLFQIEIPVECPGVRVSIVNALGTVVSTTDLYAHPATLRAPDVAGVYLLRMVTNKGVAYCRKLVVKN